MKKRKVLIPLDGSEFSRQILPVVRSFFDPRDVVLVLFRAAFAPTLPPEVMPHDVFIGGVPVSAGYDAYNRAVESGYSAVEREKETFRSELREEMRIESERLIEAGYSVIMEIQFGDPSQRIIDYCNDTDIDLVAMATHGRSGLGRLMLGSVAERVLRGVSVPVLLMRTAPAPERETTPGEQLAKSLGGGRYLAIAAATDGSTHGQEALEWAAQLVQSIHTQLTVLVTVSEREGSAHAQRVMEDACEHVAYLEPKPQATPLVGYADEEILQYTARHPVDLLVIGAFQDRGAGAATAIGPTAQRLVQHAPTSVLMVKGRQVKLKKILTCVAVDDQTAVDVAAQLARATGAELQVLHVIPPSAAPYLSASAEATIPVSDVLAQGTHLSEVVKGWIDKLETQDFEREAVVVKLGSAPETILETAHDGRFDLIVVGSQSGAGHFLGSVANSVARFAEQSVLIVRTRAQ